jgi:tetratricopeptide (TPR) repeat protein
MGNLDGAISHLRAATAINVKIGAHWRVISDLANLSATYLQGGRCAEALECAITGLRDAMAMSNMYLIASLAINAGEACYHLSDCHRAEQYARQALACNEAVHHPYAVTLLGMAALGRAQLESAHAHFESAVHSARESADPLAEGYALRWLGQCLRAMNRGADALSAFESALSLFDDMGLSNESVNTRKLMGLSGDEPA